MRAHLACAAALLLIGGEARAQSPAAAVFERLKQNAIEHTREIFAAGARRVAVERAAREAASAGPTRVPALEPESAAAAADRLSLAARTDVEDVEAGVSISPFALVGRGQAPGLRLTLAAVKDDKFRAGVGYTFDSWRPLLTPEQLGLANCTFDEAEERALRLALDTLGPSFDKACSLIGQVGAGDLDTAAATARWTSARVACGLLAPAATSLERRGPGEGLTLVEALANIRSTVGEASRKNPGLVSAAATTAKPDLGQLKDFRLPTPTACHRDEAIRAAFLRREWERPRRKIGFSLTADFFPRRFGFNPDAPDPSRRLPHGELSNLELASEGTWSRRRVELALGAALRRARESHLSGLATSIAPSVAVSVAAFSLSGHPLVGRDGPQFADGELPPHAVLGLRCSADVATDPSDTQTTRLNGVSIQPFAEFKITDKVAVRIAAPLKAELATRPADEKQTPPVVERRSLQWSVPFLVTTIVRL
jgi:hypothetical protein